MKKSLKSLAVTASALATTASTAFAATNIEVPQSFFTDIGDLINRALKFVMVLGALLVFAYLIWGGIEWITSGGDKGKTESARNKITAAVVGLIVLAASYAILVILLNFLNAGDLNTLFTEAGI